MSGLMGDKDAGKEESKQATLLQERAVRELEKVGVPSIEAQRIALESPELILSTVEERMQRTAMEDIETDSRLAGIQEEYLQDLEQQAKEGMSPEEVARFEALRDRTGADEQARQQSILQSMAQRGALDSGSMLAARLASSQSSAQNQLAQGREMAAQQSAARRDAAARRAQMATGMEQQQYGQQADLAKSRDAIAQFNTQVAARDTAAKQQQARDVADIANRQEMHNKALIQQQFQNQISKASGVSGALGNQAQGYMQRGAATAQASANRAAGSRQLLLGGISAAGQIGSAASDINNKKNISDMDESKVEEMLDNIQGYEYDYKDSDKYGEGRHIGPMAQDLEKSEIGRSMVKDTESGKMVDGGKMSMTLAAYVKKLKDRVEELESKSSGQEFNEGGIKSSLGGADVFSGLASKIGTGIGNLFSSDEPEYTQKELRDAQGEYEEEQKNTSDKKALKTISSGLKAFGSVSPAQIQDIRVGDINPHNVSQMVSQYMADGGIRRMGYEEGGVQTDGRIVPGDNFTGDELPDRINSGEMVLNVDQQERINQLLQELGYYRDMRGDDALAAGLAELNEDQQDQLMEVARMEREPEEMSDDSVIEARGLKRLMMMLGME